MSYSQKRLEQIGSAPSQCYDGNDVIHLMEFTDDETGTYFGYSIGHESHGPDDMPYDIYTLSEYDDDGNVTQWEDKDSVIQHVRTEYPEFFSTADAELPKGDEDATQRIMTFVNGYDAMQAVAPMEDYMIESHHYKHGGVVTERTRIQANDVETAIRYTKGIREKAISASLWKLELVIAEDHRPEIRYLDTHREARAAGDALPERCFLGNNDRGWYVYTSEKTPRFLRVDDSLS